MPGLARSLQRVVLLLILGACTRDEDRVEPITTVTPSGVKRRS